MRISNLVPRLGFASAGVLSSLLALSACGEPRPEGPPPLPPLPPQVVQPPLPPQMPAEPPPTGRLPADTRPMHYRLNLTIVPQQPRFAGSVEITVALDKPRDVIWLHGHGLTTHQVSVRAQGVAPIAARWEQVTPAGLVAVRLPYPVGPGNVLLHVDYDAPFGARGEALSQVHRDGRSYAFTQFEAKYARQTFPCFDEPAFKTPYDVTLFAPTGQEAVSNTREVERAPALAGAGLTRFTFATTEKIPSYLVAFAVGPLDIVNAAPIPPNAVRKRPLALRGVSASGRGKELSYALARTPEILAALEDYFGSEYPYDKLDIIAVPEKGGAMENPGAVTFSEGLILIDEKTAPESQRFGFASVTAHELAHMWFGDLVTMTWWDDLWLNEAFATWMAQRITAKLYPSLQADVRGTDRTHGAMGVDSLLSARQIRQEIKDDNDIANAFDGITYSKGAAVLGMFERWVGPEVFRKGIAAYMNQHRFGNAVEADLLSAVSAAAGRDVMTPFRSFLFQPGVPLVEARLDCTGKPTLKLRQSRFLPIGSAGDTQRLWKIPVCARYADGQQVKESCTLFGDPEGALPLETATCPAWVMPNADAAGYYRWTLPAADLSKLAGQGYAKLTAPERMSLAGSLRVGFSKGTTPSGEVLNALAPLAADPNHAVARAPMDLLRGIDEWLRDDAAVTKNMQAYEQRLYAPVFQSVGWEPPRGKPEDEGRTILRREVIEFLAERAKDAKVRKEAEARGRAYLGIGKDGALHLDAVSADLAGVALRVLGEEGDAGVFDAARSLLATTRSEPVRRNLLGLLGSVTKPELAARTRELVLDPKLAFFEALSLLQQQISRPETREASWEWLKAHLDAVVGRFPPSRAASVVWFGGSFCEQRLVDDFQRVLGVRVQPLEGGPRDYASAVEGMNLCIARRKAQEPSARAFFSKKTR